MQGADDGAVLDQLESDLLAVESALAELDQLMMDDPRDTGRSGSGGFDQGVGDVAGAPGDVGEPSGVGVGPGRTTSGHTSRRDAILGIVSGARFAGDRAGDTAGESTPTDATHAGAPPVDPTRADPPSGDAPPADPTPGDTQVRSQS